MSSWRISHFGINPVSGGNPPSESRISGVRQVIRGAFVQEMASVLIVVASLTLKTKNVENVIIKYVKRVRKVRDGAN